MLSLRNKYVMHFTMRLLAVCCEQLQIFLFFTMMVLSLGYLSECTINDGYALLGAKVVLKYFSFHKIIDVGYSSIWN